MNQHDTTAIWNFQSVVLRAVWHFVWLKSFSFVSDFNPCNRRRDKTFNMYFFVCTKLIAMNNCIDNCFFSSQVN